MKAIYTMIILCLSAIKLSAQIPTPALSTTPGFMLGPSVNIDTSTMLARHKTPDALKQLIASFNANRQTSKVKNMLVYSTMPIKHLKVTDKMPVAARSPVGNMPVKKVVVTDPTKMVATP